MSINTKGLQLSYADAELRAVLGKMLNAVQSAVCGI